MPESPNSHDLIEPDAHLVLREFLKTKRRIPIGKSWLAKSRAQARMAESRAHEPNSLYHFELDQDSRIPVVSAVVSKLARRGIITEADLIDCNVNGLLGTRGFGRPTIELIKLIQAVCIARSKSRQMRK